MRVAVTLALLAFVLAGCGTQQQESPETGPEIIHTNEQGDVSVTVRASSGQVTVADRLQFTIEARTPESAEVELPDPGEQIGEFTVVRYENAEPRLIGEDRLLTARTWLLDPPLAGEYEIPSFEIRLGDGRTLETQAIPISVVSVIPETEEAPELRDIAPPVAMPGFSPWVYFLMGVGAAAIAAGAYLLLRRRRRRAEMAAAPEPPHQVALRELRRLLDENLIEKGEAKLFYLRLSNILRRYVEDRFGIRAPEQTTEEFLSNLRREYVFADLQKELLEEVLIHCDMVKFAEHQPSREEVDGAVNSCAQFIAETRLETQEAGASQADRA